MMHCPHDNSPLELLSIEKHIGYLCNKCRGVWLPENYVQSIQYSRLLPYSHFANAITTAPKKTTYLKCPANCGQLADVTNFEPVISYCQKCHGIWFDQGELGDFLSQIPSSDGPYVVADSNTNQSRQKSLLPAYQIPPDVRQKYLLSSAFLILYGAIGAWIDDIFIPGKHGKGIHFHGTPLWFVFGAMVFAALNMISVVMDHYDTRHNEKNYRRFARVTSTLAWILLSLGFILDLLVFRSSSLFGNH